MNLIPGNRIQMVNITSKQFSLRKAVATAIVKVSQQQTMDAVINKQVPKGDVVEFSRAAGLLAIKKTSDVIPDCHPLPVEFAAISYAMEGLEILIRVEVHTIYKTGVEVEAMHGASVTALVIYDMLKPIDKAVEISSVKLVSKTGGKSEFEGAALEIKCAVVVCSDSISNGEKKDQSGKAIIAKLQNFELETGGYEIIPDDFDVVQRTVKKYVEQKYDLVIFTGGTGVFERDITPDAITPLIEKNIPGIMEAARNYGQQRTRYAMLSRGVSGFIKTTLVLTVPGSVAGVEETMDALFPGVLHVFNVIRNTGHR